jgi:TRAP-type C4-dicarboxylate transport system substrate-binding protein
VLALVAGVAHAEPVTLRMAAIAPDGTEWARALKAYAQEIEAQSHGELRMKWYLGGVAGDELAALDRVKRGQLDGEAGAIFCQKLAPTLRAARVPGLFDTREEFLYVMGRLKPTLDEEFRKSGFLNLGEAVLGIDVLFSRQPIHTMDQLVATRMWAWNLDPVWQRVSSELGMKTVVTTIEEHSPAWRKKQYDAFFTVPSAALAYQWSTEAPYFSDLGATALPWDESVGVYHVATMSDARRRGIAGNLLLLALREAQAAGFTSATLTATPEGQRIYEYLGFHVCGLLEQWMTGPQLTNDLIRHGDPRTRWNSPFRHIS